MSGRVSIDDRAEASLCATDGSINERQLSNVVLVDHSQHGALLDFVNSWVPYIVLIRCDELSL